MEWGLLFSHNTAITPDLLSIQRDPVAQPEIEPTFTSAAVAFVLCSLQVVNCDDAHSTHQKGENTLNIWWLILFWFIQLDVSSRVRPAWAFNI